MHKYLRSSVIWSHLALEILSLTISLQKIFGPFNQRSCYSSNSPVFFSYPVPATELCMSYVLKNRIKGWINNRKHVFVRKCHEPLKRLLFSMLKLSPRKVKEVYPTLKQGLTKHGTGSSFNRQLTKKIIKSQVIVLNHIYWVIWFSFFFNYIFQD